MINKKLFSAILFFLLLLFTGCTDDSDKATLTFSTWGSQSEMKILMPLIKGFEDAHNVKIKVIHIPENYFQKLHLLFASKQAPDVIFINNYYLPLYAKAGLLHNLASYFEKEIENDTFFNNSLVSFNINGAQYAIPRDVSNMVLYYNKKMFDKNNLRYPNEHWTYKYLLLTAGMLTDEKHWGIGFEENPIYWEPILWAYNAELFNDKGELALDNINAKNALLFYTNLRNLYKVAPSREDSANRTMTQMFLDQKIAMQISGRWLVPKYRAEAKFDWDIAPLPNGPACSIASSDASGWAISEASPNKTLAVSFIKYLTSQNSMKKLASSGLITPARRDVAYSAYYIDGKKPKNARVFLEITKNSKLSNIPVDYNKKVEKLGKILEPYFTGKEKITGVSKFEL